MHPDAVFPVDRHIGKVISSNVSVMSETCSSNVTSEPRFAAETSCTSQANKMLGSGVVGGSTQGRPPAVVPSARAATHLLFSFGHAIRDQPFVAIHQIRSKHLPASALARR